MPKYDYRCSDCGIVYEKREGFDAPAVQTCPECSGNARRVLTPPAIVFKGSGWYVTDSRKNGSGGDTSSSATPSSGSGSSDNGGSSSSKDSSSSSTGGTTAKSEGTKSEGAAKS
jgi:putative FmdB family regulatory protein